MGPQINLGLAEGGESYENSAQPGRPFKDLDSNEVTVLFDTPSAKPKLYDTRFPILPPF